MNDLDLLSDRLHELGRHAPVPAADPLLDLRRGRAALRRRHARTALGVITAVVAVGGVAANVGSLNWSGGRPDTSVMPAGGPSTSSSLNPTPPAKQAVPPSGASTGAMCTMTGDSTPDRWTRDPLTETPEVTAALITYRTTAAAILDPTGKHLDPAKVQQSDSVQSGSACDPATGMYLTMLGIQLGWATGTTLGVVQLEVVARNQGDEPQILMNHRGWTTYDKQLPAGIASARVTEYSQHGGGHAIVVKRTDGLTVAVDTSGRWGNNVAPGSRPATDLPDVEKLLILAASPLLTFPAD